jgi:hypothetical protein
MQPYTSSAVNGFFKDHGLEAVALGDIVFKVRKGLAPIHVAIEDTPIRVHMPSSIVVQALRMAQALRLQVADSTTRAMLQTSASRDQVRLLRECTSRVVLNLFFSRGGSCMDYLTADLVATEVNGIRVYYRTREGQRGVPSERTLRCHLPPTIHTEVIQMLSFFDSIRQHLSGEKCPIAHWAIDVSKNYENEQLTRSLDGFTRSHRSFGSAPHKVSVISRTPYAREERQPPTTSELSYKR